MYSNITPGSQGSTKEICGARRAAPRRAASRAGLFTRANTKRECVILSRQFRWYIAAGIAPSVCPSTAINARLFAFTLSLFLSRIALKAHPVYTVYEGKSLFIKRPSTWYELVALPSSPPSLWSASSSILMYLSFENVFRVSLTRKMTLQKGTNFVAQITSRDIKVRNININSRNTNCVSLYTRACSFPLSQTTRITICWGSTNLQNFT